MTSKIVLKKSSVQGKVPLVADLDYGELALNYRDGKLFYKDNNNVIQELTGGGSGSGDMTKSIYDTNNNGIVDQAAAVPWSGITDKPTFATVATSGLYSDLTGTPIVGTDVQGWSSNLDSWSAIATTTKQDTLVSGTNIKSVNSISLLGSGNLAVQEVLVSGTNLKSINSTSLLGSGNLAVQEVLVSGTNIKSINSTSLLGSGDVQVQATLVSGTNIKSIDGTSLLGSGDYTVLPTVGQATGDIHGIVDRTASTLSFNEGTRTFTITPVSGSWTFYNKGTLYTISTAKSLQIANTSGTTFIRFNVSTLELEQYGPIPDFTNDVIVAYIYWNATTQKCLILGDERHGSKRDTTWHSNQHLNVGTIWRSGGGLTFTTNNASSVQLGIGTPLVLADEDLAHTINHSATPSADYQQILNTAASLEVLYLDGTIYTATTQSTTPWIAGTSLARYNLVNAGSGSLVDAGEGKYITYWLLGTNDTRRPVKLVLGRAEHSSLDAAYAEEFTEYGLSFAEQVFMYQVVVQTSASYTANTAKIVIAGVRRVLSKLATTASTVSATQHNVLTGREASDSHPIAAITNLQTALDGKQATLVSGTNIKTINSTSLLGSGDVAVQSTLVSGTNIKTINSTSLLGSGDVAVQATLVSGTNIKTINSTSLLGSGDVAVQPTLVSGTNIKTINSTSLLGSGDVAVQATLVSGTNIKTINGNSLLGSGDLTISGGSGSPGGSNTHVQYNNNGSFGGSANFTYDSTTNRFALLGTDAEFELQGITTEPATPAAGRLLLYAKSIGGRMMPKFMGPSGYDTAVQASVAQNKVALYNPAGNSNTVPVVFGHSFTANGTATARNVATTNVFTRAKRIGYVSGAQAGNYTGLYNAAAGTQYTVGTGTVGVGGFYLVIRFGISNAATLASQITFVGLSSTTAAPNITADPATFTNSIGIGCSAADTTLRLFYGGSAAQTPIALGANFPAKTQSTDWYELILFSPSNVNNVVSYRVQRINTGQIAEGTITAAAAGTQLPASTTLLGIRAYTSNNATAQAVGIDFGIIYMETDT